ncbi:MAG: cobalamin adenosyltransferase, partial [Terrisporobacter sp.]
MGVLTENEVRKKIGKNKDKITQYYIEKGQIITPSAKSYLIDKNIELKYVDKISEINNESKEAIKE